MKGIVNVCAALLVAVGVMGAVIVAQAPAANALSELETAYVQIVALAGQLADCQANQLEVVKQAQNVRGDALIRIEKAHPGFTIDWQTGTLVAKPATTK